MLNKWKLRRARRQFTAALMYSEQLRDEAKHVQERVLPELQQRVEIAELAVLGVNYEVALADPSTPASQTGRLIALAIQGTELRRKLFLPVIFGLSR